MEIFTGVFLVFACAFERQSSNFIGVYKLFGWNFPYKIHAKRTQERARHPPSRPRREWSPWMADSDSQASCCAALRVEQNSLPFHLHETSWNKKTCYIVIPWFTRLYQVHKFLPICVRLLRHALRLAITLNVWFAQSVSYSGTDRVKSDKAFYISLCEVESKIKG